MKDMEKLRRELSEMAKYGSALAVLGWDEQVYMPEKAREFRGEVMAQMSADLHRRFTADNFVTLVKKLKEPQSFEKLSADEKVIARETWRDLQKSLKIPSDRKSVV
jgi:carboxypeptidase Taq